MSLKFLQRQALALCCDAIETACMQHLKLRHPVRIAPSGPFLEGSTGKPVGTRRQGMPHHCGVDKPKQEHCDDGADGGEDKAALAGEA